jgi:hypothetical protein
MADLLAVPSIERQVAVLVLAAHYFDSAWNDRVEQASWDWAIAEELVSQTRDQAGEGMPFLTDRGQQRLQELLADG